MTRRVLRIDEHSIAGSDADELMGGHVYQRPALHGEHRRRVAQTAAGVRGEPVKE